MKTEKNSNRHLILSLKLMVCLIGFSGCTHYYYVPNAHNVPLFQEKHEGRISAGACTGNYYKGGDFQSAASLSEHFGIMINGMTARGEYTDTGHFWSDGMHHTGSGRFLEFGSGYFKTFSINNRLVIESYGTVGFGKVTNGYDLKSSSVNFQRYSIQPAIGFTGEVFDIAFSTRFSILNYANISYDAGIPESEAIYLNHLLENQFSLLAEPALTVRIGYRNLKFQCQLGLSNNLSIPEFRNNFNLNAGIVVAITDKFH